MGILNQPQTFNVDVNNVTFFSDMMAGSEGGWVAAASGTGASNILTANAPTSQELGIMQNATGTLTTGLSVVRLGTTTVLFGGGRHTAEFKVRIPLLSDATERFSLLVGFIDATSNIVVDGAFFRYNDNINSGRIQLVTSSNSVQSTADSGVTMAINTWYKLRVEVNNAGTLATYSINGTVVGTIATNIPNTTGRNTGVGASIAKELGTTSRLCEIDYAYYNAVFNPIR
jgi:hypothetical protein